jgi:copper homeostasis protein
MSQEKILEIACFNLESALIAEAAGADRIELCVDYEVGGVSPPKDMVDLVRQKIKIPIHVMVRPRAGNFIYSEIEKAWLLRYSLFCKSIGVDGIVIGALTEENEIDLDCFYWLRDVSDMLSITFHRAIDQCNELEKSFEQLINLGVNRVLTSGGNGNASNNISKLKQLQTNFGNSLSIMPGGGIRASNLKSILESGCREFHSAALTGKSLLADAQEIKKIKQLLTATT